MLRRSNDALKTADASRESHPQAALELYLAATPEDVLEVEERLEWVLGHCLPLPPEGSEPLLELAAERVEGKQLSRVLNGLATLAWYRGEVERAEALWRRELEASRERRDQGWIRAQNNLALCLSQRGAYFQALVLFGGSARASSELGLTQSLSYALCRRGQMLALLGDHERAHAAFEGAEEAWTRIESDEERDFLASSLVSARARLHLARRDWPRFLEAQERRIALLGEVPPQQHPTLANAHTLRLRALHELQPERGADWLAELEGLSERFELSETWEVQWRAEVARARLRLARDASAPPEERRRHATAFVEAAVQAWDGSERITELVSLGVSCHENGLDDIARRSFDLAATSVLRQLVSAERLDRDIPELADATAEDWSLLGEYRQRLAREQGTLLKEVATRWRPDDRVFERVVVDELIRLCAWCSRLHTKDDAWIPLAEFLPETSAFDVTHVICDTCMRRELEAD